MPSFSTLRQKILMDQVLVYSPTPIHTMHILISRFCYSDLEQVKNSRLDSLALPPLPLLQTLDLRDNKVNLQVSVVFLSSCVEMVVGLGYLAEMGRGQYPGIGTNLNLCPSRTYLKHVFLVLPNIVRARFLWTMIRI